MKNWLNNNKVILIGLLQVVLTALYEILNGTSEASIYTISFSVILAVCAYLGRNLRAQWASVFTTLGSSLTSFLNLHQDSNGITTREIITQLMVLGLTCLGIFWSSPSKDRGYEHTSVIEGAKAEGKQITKNL